jgi:hypothetical protein
MDGGLRSRRRSKVSEDVDPLTGAINIVDAMLVFACGLMLALVIRWNVDLAQAGARAKVTPGEDVSQVPDIREDLIETQGEGELYEKMGTVYKDPKTGELFMLTDE